MSEEEHIEIPAKHEALGEELNRAEDVDNLHTLLLAHEEHNEEEEEEEEELPEYKWITRYEAIHYYDTNRLLYYVLVVHDFVRRRIVKQKYFDTVDINKIGQSIYVVICDRNDIENDKSDMVVSLSHCRFKETQRKATKLERKYSTIDNNNNSSSDRRKGRGRANPYCRPFGAVYK
ncbi:hypothetical protein RFI_09563 [Reticulomyxa filosa]|uniref:Uncharacterized protein n=1 Tax=Reticulomyxa filosa TaxID=46433 RepID=X6NPE9_RETFI|nr:hypothetical protein RFI_09563 [Reticulomyxa filosa]|eukprot:ETO27569.1 hypothetical protein RFI_09563 [Reticulomyxa filosa]